MIRYTCIILDMSEYMLTLDYRPHPLQCIVEIVKKFIIEYYDRNPLSQISIFITKDGKCIRLTPMSSLMKMHCNCLDVYIYIYMLYVIEFNCQWFSHTL